MAQTVAHEPERAPAPPTAADPQARLAVAGLTGVLLLDVAVHLYQFLHTCMVENVVWGAMQLPPSSAWQCVAETRSWLPFMLRHLIR